MSSQVLAPPPLITALILAVFSSLKRVVANEADPKSDLSIKSLLGVCHHNCIPLCISLIVSPSLYLSLYLSLVDQCWL